MKIKVKMKMKVKMKFKSQNEIEIRLNFKSEPRRAFSKPQEYLLHHNDNPFSLRKFHMP